MIPAFSFHLFACVLQISAVAPPIHSGFASESPDMKTAGTRQTVQG